MPVNARHMEVGVHVIFKHTSQFWSPTVNLRMLGKKSQTFQRVSCITEWCVKEFQQEFWCNFAVSCSNSYQSKHLAAKCTIAYEHTKYCPFLWDVWNHSVHVQLRYTDHNEPFCLTSLLYAKPKQPSVSIKTVLHADFK